MESGAGGGEMKTIVSADLSVTGEDFHERLRALLTQAAGQRGLSLERLRGELASHSHDVTSLTASADAFAALVERMERTVSLGEEFEPSSGRKGWLGRLHKFVKRVIIRIKQKTDAQVEQQGDFNQAVYILVQVMAGQLDTVRQALEETRARQRELGAAIEELRERLLRASGEK